MSNSTKPHFLTRSWTVLFLLVATFSLQAQTYLDARSEKQFNVNRCSLPFIINNQGAPANYTCDWELVNGEAILEGSLTDSILVVGDFKDTVELVYRIRFNNSITSSDTIQLTNDWNNNCSGMIIDRSGLPSMADCADTFTVKASVDTNRYNFFYWFGDNVELLSSVLGKEMKFKVKHGGTYRISLITGATFSQYVAQENLIDSTFCDYPLTQANAGPNITTDYCNIQSFAFAANPVGPGETGSWSNYNNSNTIYPQNIHNAGLYDIRPGTYRMIWSIENATEISQDTMILTVLPSACPVSNAGTDINAFCGDTIVLSANQPDLYEDGIWRVVTGNVTLVNNTNPTTKAVVHSAGICQLEWRVNSVFGYSSNVDFMNIQAVCRNSIQGTIKSAGSLQQFGTALLLQKVNNDPVLIKKTNIHNGTYKFENVISGNYYVYAIPFEDASGSEVDNDFLPTFYVNKLAFDKANVISVSGNTFGVDINLAPKSASLNQNSLRVIAPNHNNIIGELPLLIFDENEDLVSSALLKNNEAIFYNINNGSYSVDIPFSTSGYERYTIELSGNSESILNLTTAIQVSSNLLSEASVYPNPVESELHLNLPALDEEVRISILNYTSGQELISRSSKEQFVTINTDHLNPGMYLLKLESRDATRMMLVNKVK